MYESRTGHAVREMLETMVTARSVTPSQRDGFRERVYAAVDELKSMGWPIERIIVRMKEVAAESGLATRFDRVPRENDIVSDAVKWSIERYFAAGPRNSTR